MDRVIRKFFLGMAMALVVAAPGIALADGAQGLGLAQPSQADVSTNPQFHVYKWVRTGVTYVQVNDTAGNVQLAIATGGGEVLVLPIGQPDAVQVAPASENTNGAVVYSDSGVLIRQVSSGYVVSAVTSSASSTSSFSPTVQADCGNPADCSQNP